MKESVVHSLATDAKIQGRYWILGLFLGTYIEKKTTEYYIYLMQWLKKKKWKKIF